MAQERKCTCKLKIIPIEIEENCPWHNSRSKIFGMEIVFDETLPKTIILLKGAKNEIAIDLINETVTVLPKIN